MRVDTKLDSCPLERFAEGVIEPHLVSAQVLKLSGSAITVSYHHHLSFCPP